METSYIGLKWGILKEWKFITNEEIELGKKYFDLGVSTGCMHQKDSPEQKEIIYQLIDLCNNPEGIYLEWDGKYVTKEEAKEYINNYGVNKPLVTE